MPTAATKWPSDINLSRTFEHLEDAAKESWYGAVIATPANLHVDHAAALLASTPAFLIEKPLCTKLDDAERLRQIAAGKVVQVGYVLRNHPAVQHVRSCSRRARSARCIR